MRARRSFQPTHPRNKLQQQHHNNSKSSPIFHPKSPTLHRIDSRSRPPPPQTPTPHAAQRPTDVRTRDLMPGACPQRSPVDGLPTMVIDRLFYSGHRCSHRNFYVLGVPAYMSSSVRLRIRGMYNVFGRYVRVGLCACSALCCAVLYVLDHGLR